MISPSRMRPNKITADYSIKLEGDHRTSDISARVNSLELTLNRGMSADSLIIEFDDADGQLELPKRGRKLTLELGWSGTGNALIKQGEFIIDAVIHSGAPDKIKVSGNSLDFRSLTDQKKTASYSDSDTDVAVKSANSSSTVNNSSVMNNQITITEANDPNATARLLTDHLSQEKQRQELAALSGF